MTNTIDGALAYAKAHPKRDGGYWAGWCESFVYRAGGFTGSFSNALLAGNASGWLNPDWAKAPRGAIHYWAGVGGDGHVAFELGGGTLLMASSKVSNLGTALGTIHFTDYNLPLYRGWSMRHGTESLTVASTTPAGETAKPIVADLVARILEGETMIVKRSATGEVAIFGADFAEADGSRRGRHVFASADEYNAYKSITETVRREGGAAVTLPAFDSPQIVGLDTTGWRTVCNVHGV